MDARRGEPENDNRCLFPAFTCCCVRQLVGSFPNVFVCEDTEFVHASMMRLGRMGGCYSKWFHRLAFVPHLNAMVDR